MEDLRESLTILTERVSSNRYGGRTDRLKAIRRVQHLLAQGYFQSVLFTNSCRELITGPAEFPEDAPLTWPYVVAQLTSALDVECVDCVARASKASSSNPRRDFPDALKTAISFAERFRGTSFLHGLVLRMLDRIGWCLDEPRVKASIGDDLWKCARELLENPEYRSQVGGRLYRVWIDKCIGQLKHQFLRGNPSDISTSSARRLLVLLSNEVPTTDILAQRGRHGANTSSSNLGYVYILQQCCELLRTDKDDNVAGSTDNLDTRGALLEVLGTIMEERALDIMGSAVVEMIGDLVLVSISKCWLDRKLRPTVLHFGSILLRLARPSRPTLNTLRRLIECDLNEKGNNARMKLFKEPEDDLVAMASMVFTGQEIVERLKLSDSFHSATAWLYVLNNYLMNLERVSSSSSKLSSNGQSLEFSDFQPSRSETRVDLLAAQQVSLLFDGMGENTAASSPPQFVREAARSLHYAAKCSIRYDCPPSEEEMAIWSGAYKCLFAQLANSNLITHGGRKRRTEKRSLDCVVLALSTILRSSRYSPAKVGYLEAQGRAHDWWSIPLLRGRSPSDALVLFAYTHLSRVGFQIDDSGESRVQLLTFLCSTCNPVKRKAVLLENSSFQEFYSNAAIATFNVVHGMQPKQSPQASGVSRVEANLSVNSFNMLKALQYLFGMSEFSSFLICSPGRHSEVLERTLFPVGGGWFDYFFGSELEADEREAMSSSQVSQSSMDDNTRRRLNKRLVSIITDYEEKLSSPGALESSGYLNDKEEDNDENDQCQDVALGEESELVRLDSRLKVAGASGVIAYCAEYLVYVVNVYAGTPGFSKCGTTEFAETYFILLTIVSRLFQRLSKSVVDLIVSEADVVRAALVSILRLCDALCSKDRTIALSEAVTPYASSLKESVIGFLDSVAGSIVDTLKKMSANAISNLRNYLGFHIDHLQGREMARVGRKRRHLEYDGPNPQKRYKQDDLWESDESSDASEFDEGKAEGPQIIERRVASENSDDMEDKQDSQAHKLDVASRTIPWDIRCARRRLASESTALERVEGCATILEAAMRTLPSVGESIVTQLGTGLNMIVALEEGHHDEGEDSHFFIFSRMIHSSYTFVRIRIWQCLMLSGSAKGTEIAMEDAVRLGKKRDQLDARRDLFNRTWTDRFMDRASSRKAPSSIYLEDIRQTLLTYVTLYLQRCLGIGVAKCHRTSWIQPSPRRIKLIDDSLTLVDSFRAKDGFKMPRVSRALFAGCVAVALELFMGPLGSCYAQSGSLGDSRQTLLSRLKRTFQKLQSDLDACVRLVAGGLVPILPRLTSLDYEAIIADDLLSYLPATCNHRTSAEEDLEDILDASVAVRGTSRPVLETEVYEAAQVITPELRKAFARVGDFSRSRTAIIALGELAAAHERCRSLSLYHILVRVKDFRADAEFVRGVLARLSARTGYQSIEDCFRAFANPIFIKWFHNKHNLFSFPAGVLLQGSSSDSLCRLVKEYLPDLLPLIVLEDDDALTGIKNLASLLGTDHCSLLRRNVDALARIYPCYFTEVTSHHHKGRRAWDRLEKHIPELVDLIRDDHKAVITAIVLSISAGHECSDASCSEASAAVRERNDLHIRQGFERRTSEVEPPYFDALVIGQAVEQLLSDPTREKEPIPPVPVKALSGSLFKSNCAPTSKSLMSCRYFRRSKDLLAVILTRIWQRIEGPPGPPSSATKRNAVFSLGFLWRLLGGNLLTNSLTRSLFIHVILLSVHHEEIASDAFYLLSRVTKAFLNSRGEEPKLEMGQWESMVQQIVPCLTSLVCSRRRMRAMAVSALRELLKTSQNAGALLAIEKLDPFPPHRSFTELNKYREAALQSLPKAPRDPIDVITREMVHFLSSREDYVFSQSPVHLFARIARLRDSVIPHTVLMRRWLSGQSDSERRFAALTSQVLSALVSILRECAQKPHLQQNSTSPFIIFGNLYDSKDSSLEKETAIGDVAIETAHLIGLIGSMSTTAMVLRSHETGFLTSFTPTSLDDRDVNDKIAGACLGVSLLIANITCDNVVVASASITSLSEVLCCPESGVLVGKQTPADKAVLGAFGSLTSLKKKFEALTNEFSECLVCPRTGLARHLALPHLLSHELWDPSRGLDLWVREVSTVLSKNCRTPSLRRMGIACFTSGKLASSLLPYMLLDVVTAVNKKENTTLSSLIAKHLINNKDCHSSIISLMIEAFHLLSRVSIRIVRTKGIQAVSGPYFILNVNGLDVARAANKSGARFAAIQHCEWYLDQKGHEHICDYEREVEVSDEELESPWIKDVNLTMLNALEHINEPDGVHAVVFSESFLKTSAILASVDSDWTLALGTNDSLASSNGVDSRRELAITASLMGLGAYNVVQDYWMGLCERASRLGWVEGTTLDDILRLNEARFRASWTLGVWENPKLLRSVVIGSGRENYGPFTAGVHQSVHSSLHALSMGNATLALKTASKATDLLARSVCNDASSSSAKFIYERSGELRLLADVELAGAILISKGSRTDLQSRFISSAPFLGQDEKGRAQRILRRIQAGMNQEKKGFEALEDYWRRTDQDFLYSSKRQIDTIDVIEPLLQLRVSIALCLGLKHRVSRLTADLAGAILRQGGTGSWARAAGAIYKGFEYLTDASPADRALWRLQEAKLRWMGGTDGSVKLQALRSIKRVISDLLQGRIQHSQNQSSRPPSEHSDPSRTSNPGSSSLRRSGRALSSNLVLRSPHGSRSNNKYDTTSLRGANRFTYTWGLVDSDSKESTATLRSEACKLAAEWALSLHTNEPMAVFDTFLQLGLAAFKDIPDCEAKSNTQYVMGAFADIELAKIDDFQKSEKYEKMLKTLQANEANVKEWEEIVNEHLQEAGYPRKGRAASSRSLSNSSNAMKTKFIEDLLTRKRAVKKSASHDRAKLIRLTRFRSTWQLLAIKHYSATLREGSRHDIRAAFRLASLWMEANGSRPEVDALIADDNGLKVPASKLLPVLYQLSSRLSTSGNKNFQRTLSRALFLMAVEYPHHCIWQLIALNNATRESPSAQKGSSLFVGDKDKADAAHHILNMLDGVHAHVLKDMRKLSEAYIDSTQLKRSAQSASGKAKLSASLTSLRNLENVRVPTIPLPLHGGVPEEEEMVSVIRFSSSGRFVGGMNAPVKVICYGSDGHEYPQLIKGNDDLRQDAVMEQLFRIANSLLFSDPASQLRSLSIRTYSVLPLTPCSGVLQWVSNTAQFREYLIENTKDRKCAHIRYRPDDMSPADIASKMSSLRQPHQASQRVAELKKIWPRFQPVFRHFFTERYPNPLEWYTRRLAYTRSVATSSIVGYIIGLGDRHTSNLLIDSSTAEVVHIDLGIAFEQGRLLPTPEKMPFRLTRDVVDGFGVTGVEGVFRSCCETTLCVLRANRDVLLTVIEVFLHDPLYKWAQTPRKVLRNQREEDVRGTESVLDDVVKNLTGSKEGRRDAQRVLIRVGEKLDGSEGNERLSVESHVSWLIDEARNPVILMCAYPGWMPWV